ncbi:MAG: hypothetical protein WCZ28_05970 [Burkholderiaceae bacterium]
MLEFLWKLLGRDTATAGHAGETAAGATTLRPPDEALESVEPGRKPVRRANPQTIGARRSLAKMTAKTLAFDTKDGKYRTFKARSDAGIRRLLGCGPTLNVDGTPMVGDTGVDERGKPYGVTEDFG